MLVNIKQWVRDTHGIFASRTAEHLNIGTPYGLRTVHLVKRRVTEKVLNRYKVDALNEKDVEYTRGCTSIEEVQAIVDNALCNGHREIWVSHLVEVPRLTFPRS